LLANKGLNAFAYNLAKENFDGNCTNLVLMLNPNNQFTRMVLALLMQQIKTG